MKAELKIKSVVLSLLFWKEKVFLKSHLICFSTMQYSKINKSSVLLARTFSLFDNFIDNFVGKVRVCVSSSNNCSNGAMIVMVSFIYTQVVLKLFKTIMLKSVPVLTLKIQKLRAEATLHLF